MRSAILIGLATIGLLGISTVSAQDWTVVSDESDVRFATVKAGAIAENHSFLEVHGVARENGTVELRIPVTSVDTGIEIRNGRMLEHLFKAPDFPDAVLTADLDLSSFEDLAMGDMTQMVFSAEMTLVGESMPVDLELQITRITEDRVMVHTLAPVMLDADFFGLLSGIEILRELAGLDSISQIVPVTASLTFCRYCTGE